MNIIKHRYLFFAISLLVIIPGILALIFWGLPLSIDFEGGSMLEVQFPAGKTPSSEAVINVYQQFDRGTPQVQTSEDNILVVRSFELDEEEKVLVVNELAALSGTEPVILRFDKVSAAVGKEVATKAAGAVAVAALAILLYITFAFRGVKHSFRYGTAAIFAMLHDVLVIVGIEAILCRLFGWEVDSLFLTALLTVIGFSVHDTIVVFDRIRENSNIYRKLPYETVVNHSIVQTMDRSINTSVTVMLTLLALTLFGGITIRHFVLILLIGVFSGTYSSIFNASPILVVWENREWNTWFKKKDSVSA